jgi:hypothetical protein
VKLVPRHLTLRARLTLIYGGLFLVAGMLLLGATYALFSQQLNGSSQKYLVRIDDHRLPAGGTKSTGLFVLNPAGDVLTGSDAERVMAEQRQRVHDAATKSLLTQGGIALLLVGGLAAGFGWLVAGRVLAPPGGSPRRPPPATVCTNE